MWFWEVLIQDPINGKLVRDNNNWKKKMDILPISLVKQKPKNRKIQKKTLLGEDDEEEELLGFPMRMTDFAE